MQTPKATRVHLRDSPGWFFVVILLGLIPICMIANLFLLDGEMGGWALAWTIGLGALFIWITAWRERPGQLTELPGAEPPDGEHKWWIGFRFKPRLLGSVGGPLFSIIGYYVAERAGISAANAEHWLLTGKRGVFAAFLAIAILGGLLAPRLKRQTGPAHQKPKGEN